MKKYFLIILSYISIITASNADVVTDYISNLIPGDGDTELSIDLRENHSADFSILLVRELDSNQSNNTFTQLSLFNTEKNSDDRIVANLGLGKRFLSEDKTLMSGLNSFIDVDDAGNLRTSIGIEARSAVVEFAYNQYFGIENAKDEKVLDGYDLRLASQIPHLHWADIFINTYEWEGKDRDDIKGTKLGSELLLTPNINLELAHDDKDKKGLEDEWYVHIEFVYPPRSGSSLQDGFINSSTWKKEKDMTGELLTKVKRNNKIMVEFKGSSTISRTD